METKPDETTRDAAQLIDRLGGSAALARKLGLDTRHGGVQRVENWKTRGIPRAVLLDNLRLFGLTR